MRGCVSFQIKVQILAFYTDVCTAPKTGRNFYEENFPGVARTACINPLHMHVGCMCVRTHVPTYEYANLSSKINVFVSVWIFFPFSLLSNYRPGYIFLFAPADKPFPSRFFFCDPVVLELICYRTRAKRLRNEGNTNGGL